MKRLAKSLAYFVIGFIFATTVSHTMGIPYTIALFAAVGAIVFINESEAK